jgi:two-component system response regulator FixJ
VIYAKKANRTIYLVDNDASVRHKLSVFLKSSGYSVQSFRSAESFLEKTEHLAGDIMLLDQHMAGMSGLDLQAELSKCGVELPIIFITGHGDVQTTVKAMKNGAINVLEKPVKNEVLLESVSEAFLHADRIRIRRQLKIRYSRMTNREREVMQHVVTGESNNGIAKLLDVTVRTVETHRSRVMKKMGAKSLPDLVRIYAICQIAYHGRKGQPLQHLAEWFVVSP